VFFFSSRRRHTSFSRDWSSDVCSSDLGWRAFHQAWPGGCGQSLRTIDTATPVISLSGEDFVRTRQATLGETLATQPGVNVDSYRSEERRVGKERRTVALE